MTIGHNPFKPNLGLSQHIVLKTSRYPFIDEILYEKLYQAAKPFAGSILRSISKNSHSSKLSLKQNDGSKVLNAYGSQHIDPMILRTPMFLDFVMNSKEALKSLKNQVKGHGTIHKSDDPAMIMAFSSRLDSNAQEAQERQVYVQQFYECRIASLHRYISFCVMFHSMAKSVHKPLFCIPWDLARSQSNLRVATTGKHFIKI